MTSDQTTASYVAEASSLGHAAAMTLATWLEMSEEDAASIAGDDIDPAVYDSYPGPNLSGEWSGDPTPASIYDDIVGDRDVVDADLEDALADAWIDAADAAWSDALQMTAFRVLADAIEARLGQRADALQSMVSDR